MFDNNTFNNKIALVTGGRSGIGYQIAKDLLQLGATVIIASRKEEPLKKAADELAKFGTVNSHPCDIRKTEEIQGLVKVIQEKCKRYIKLILCR